LHRQASLPVGACGDGVMVGEQDHLADLPKPGEKCDGRSSAHVVEGDQHVVGNAGQQLGLRRIVVDGRRAQFQIS
jgi:hypothetical protein